MKYNIAMIVLVLLGAVVVAHSYIQSNRAEQKILAVRAHVSAMSPQKLAAGIAECDPVRSPGERQRQNSTFCNEIRRALDEQRLELVDVRPTAIYLPLSLPRLRLRTPEIEPHPPRDDLSGRAEIFEVAKTG